MGGGKIFCEFFCCGCKKIKKDNPEGNVSLLDVRYDNFDDSEYVKGVDLCINKNGTDHHTSKYFHMRQAKKSNLIVRRGQSFRIEILLKTTYVSGDSVAFLFESKDTKIPRLSNGTMIAVTLSEENDTKYSWKAVIVAHEKNRLIVDITPSPNCIVSRWSIEVAYTRKESTEKFKLPQTVFVLFNPWCEKDQVFMESDEWLQEAVLNPNGMIWQRRNPVGCTWNYAQFDEDILDCAMDLLVRIGEQFRSNPILIGRGLSALMNANDDGGVLLGNWGNNYKDGISPLEWTGSRDILQQYYRTKTPVRYGQCWVFAGILTTVCRTLGIPSRAVTNFDSGHDQNGSITLDYIVDEDGKASLLDSCWNYHVWTEVWMKRPDLGIGCDGWQALDATPQEKSGGLYRCGPASVAACKNGDVTKPYDVGFVFSEVNADRVYWKKDHNKNTYQLIGTSTDTVGTYISTKAPGNYQRLDITNDYKFKEGTSEERATYLKTMRQVENVFAKLYVANEFEEVTFKFKYYDDITVGDTFDISLIMINTNKTKARDVNTKLLLEVYSYTGKLVGTIQSKQGVVSLPASSQKEFKLTISYPHYKDYLTGNCFFVISCLATVSGTSWCYYDRDDVQIKRPNVGIDVKQKGKVGEQIKGRIMFENPLPVPLKKGRFIVEAPGFGQQMKIAVKQDVGVGQKVVQEFSFTPQLPGLHVVAAKFISNQLDELEGFLQIAID